MEIVLEKHQKDRRMLLMGLIVYGDGFTGYTEDDTQRILFIMYTLINTAYPLIKLLKQEENKCVAKNLPVPFYSFQHAMV